MESVVFPALPPAAQGANRASASPAQAEPAAREIAWPGATSLRLEGLDWIDAITSQIPDRGQHLVRY